MVESHGRDARATEVGLLLLDLFDVVQADHENDVRVEEIRAKFGAPAFVGFQSAADGETMTIAKPRRVNRRE